MIQIRKEDNQKKQKEKKLKVYKVNTHKKTVIALWVLLAVSFLFAVYKNFTAIDIHTVHETKVIEEQILDTHKIENFVENFAEVYYSWEQSAASIDNRTNALKGYLTGELQALNVDTVRKDIPVSSALTDFQIWEITEEKEQHYQVTYTVEQRITEGESSKTVRSAYQVTVYVDGSGNLTIIQNPTITSVPVKSGYTPKAVQSDGTVDSITTEEINEAYEKNTGLVIIETFENRKINPVYTPAVLCQNHGPFAWGKDAAEAVHNAVVLEEVAKMARLTESVNPDVKPAPDNIKEKHFYRKHGANAYYGQN